MTYNFNKEQFDETLKTNGATVLFKKITTDTITPILSALKLFNEFKDYHFLLESAQIDKKGQNSKSRFSVIGIDPDVVWKCANGKSFINKNFVKNRDDFVLQKDEVLQNFREFFLQANIDFSKLSYQGETLPAVCAGVFGYFGYDIINFIEKLPNIAKKDDIKIPDAIFMRPQILVIFDNFYDTALICAPVFQDTAKTYSKLIDKIENVENILKTNYTPQKIYSKNKFEFHSNYSEKEYCDVVEK